MAKLLAALPEWPANGLGSIADRLIDQPQKQQIAIIVIDCKETKTNNDTGDVEPHARIRQLEPITRLDDLDRIKAVLRGAFAARTGREELPLDSEGGDQ